MKNLAFLFSSLFLVVACATPSTPKTPPVKPKPAATQPAAKVYSFEPPVVPEPEEIATRHAPPEQRGSSKHAVMLGMTRTGTSVDLADYRGKLVLVSYWASWCPPCWTEMAQLEEIYADYRDRGLEIVAVNFGENDQSIESFLRRQSKPLTYMIVTDPDTQRSKEQGVRAVPTTLLFDSEGKVFKKYFGLFGFDPKRVRDDLNQLLDNENRS